MDPNLETATTILVRLRTRMNDLLKTELVTPEGFGLYQQTMLHLFSEFDQRRMSCLEQARQLRLQAASAESQAAGFTAAESLLFAVVNGFLDQEEKRLREMAERRAEQTKQAEQAEQDQAPIVPTKRSRGRPKKSA